MNIEDTNNNRDFYSPENNSKLVKTGEVNVYYDTYSHLNYYATGEGKLVKLVNPINGLPIAKREDGLYEGNNQVFYLDENRGVFIPQFVPDDTLEPAHIEGDYLIGNISGRKFPIDAKGFVNVPFDPIDIDSNASMSELNEYFEKRKQEQMSTTQEEIDDKLNEDELKNKKALEFIIEQNRNKNEYAEEIEKIKESITDGKISESNFDRLLDIAKFEESTRKVLKDAFTMSGMIIPCEREELEHSNGHSL